MDTIMIISRGVARCKYDPHGANGLEGFSFGCRYLFERAENESGKYIRVYNVEMMEDKPVNFSPPFYYETCGKGIFAKFFEIISEQSI